MSANEMSIDLAEAVRLFSAQAKGMLKKPTSRAARRAMGMTNAHKHVRLTETRIGRDGKPFAVWVASTRAPKKGMKP